MRIYTKTGDSGETSLFGGGRVPKSHPRVGAYGDVDELNAALGLARAHLPQDSPLDATLETVQRTLFGLGGEVATESESARAKLRDLVEEKHVVDLETSIDTMESELTPLKSFVLPGGAPAGAALHVARTICRRAERSLVELAKGSELRPEIIRYVNRLSDWLFVAARFANHAEGRTETLW